MTNRVNVDGATIADEQIVWLRDGEVGLHDEMLRDVCRIALQIAVPTGQRPFCHACGWRMGGVDSWDGARCKCKKSAPEYFSCGRCGGFGRVPYSLGTQPCPSCDGSGLVDPPKIAIARAQCATAWNTAEDH